MVLERVLRELQRTESGKRCVVLRLTGLLHADEKAAFAELARQLCAAGEGGMTLKLSGLRFVQHASV